MEFMEFIYSKSGRWRVCYQRSLPRLVIQAQDSQSAVFIIRGLDHWASLSAVKVPRYIDNGRLQHVERCAYQHPSYLVIMFPYILF